MKETPEQKPLNSITFRPDPQVDQYLRKKKGEGFTITAVCNQSVKERAAREEQEND